MVFDEMPKSCTVDWFAAQLHCDRRNIYRIFTKDNIDIQLLTRVSEALRHDFFADLSKELTLANEDNGHILCPNTTQ